MTPYEQLRAKLNELLPERLELRFGCEVTPDLTKNKFAGNSIGVLIGKDVSGRNEIKFPMSTCCYDKNFINDRFTILGTPPTLREILRAIGKSNPNEHLVSTKGKLIQVVGTGGMFHLMCDIDLSKPPSEWDDETIKKLNELL